MATPNYVRVNNIVYSWTSCGFFADNFGLTGIKEVSYSQKRDQKDVFANQQNGVMIGYTSGKYTLDAFSIKMLKEDSVNFQTYLAQQSNGSITDTEWTYTESLSEPVIGNIPITNVITVCRVTEIKDARAEGIDELVDELTIRAKQIITNGLTLASTLRALADQSY